MGGSRVLAEWADRVAAHQGERGEVPGKQGKGAKASGELNGAGQVVYVGTPINTGPALLAAAETARIHNAARTGSVSCTPTHIPPEDSSARHAWIVKSNLRGYRTLLAAVAADNQGAPMVDPTLLVVPGWGQRDYYRVCAEIVQRYATAAVFNEGWQLSIGCQVELAAAHLRQIPVLDRHKRAITPAAASDAIADAAVEYASAVGSRHELTWDCVHALRELAADFARE